MCLTHDFILAAVRDTLKRYFIKLGSFIVNFNFEPMSGQFSCVNG
jgi:hypothetical protein